MRTLLAVLVFICPSFLFSQSRSIPKIGEIEVDGNFKEWHQIPSISFSSNYNLPGIANEGRKAFDKFNDLNVNLKMSWNEHGLYVAIDWKDDVLDTKRINNPRDARWQHPKGGARDGMYYNDNIVIRLYKGDNYYYSCWLAPIDGNSFQWHLLREGPRGTANSETDNPKVVSRRIESGKVLIEGFWPWALLKYKPSLNEDIMIRIIPTDADQPSLPFEKKDSHMKYMHLYESFRFRN